MFLGMVTQVLEVHGIKAVGPAEQEEASRSGAAGSEANRRAGAGAAGAAGGPQAEGGLQARQQARSQQRCSGCVALAVPMVAPPLCMAKLPACFAPQDWLLTVLHDLQSACSLSSLDRLLCPVNRDRGLPTSSACLQQLE